MDIVTFLLVGIFVGFVLSKTQKPNNVIIFLAGIGTGMVLLYISAAMANNGSLHTLQQTFLYWEVAVNRFMNVFFLPVMFAVVVCGMLYAAYKHP